MRIKVTCKDKTAKPQWTKGQVVNVTDENKQRADRLLEIGGAYVLKDGNDADAASPSDDDDDDTETELGSSFDLSEGVDALATAGIDGRYIKALTDANVKTLQDVVDLGDGLAQISGVSPKAAVRIQAAIAADLDD